MRAMCKPKAESIPVGFGMLIIGITLGCLAMYYTGYGTGGCPEEEADKRRSDLMLNGLATRDASSATPRLEVPLPPTIFAITPTYGRSSQRVDLTTICHTLMHVPEITWIVVEDSVNKTKSVTNLLEKCKSVTSVHLTAKSPPKQLGRGVSQRNAGLSWIRANCLNSTAKCRGVVYLMDDDNKYDLRLFEEIRKTKKVSVFPVAFAGGLKVEGPICFENGTTASWHVSWAPERPLPIDMAGFAINVDLILKNENVVLGKDKHGKECRRLETCLLEQFTTKDTAECIPGKELMVWHVKTLVDYHHEKRNPSDPKYLV